MSLFVDFFTSIGKEILASPKTNTPVLSFNVLLVGSEGVGKTTLICNNMASLAPVTSASTTKISVTLDLHKIELRLYESQNFTKSCLVDFDAVVVVFAVDNKESFERAKEILFEYVSYTAEVKETAKIYLCGNKSDLGEIGEEGEIMAAQHGVVDVFHTCATRSDMSVMFREISKQLMKRSMNYLLKKAPNTPSGDDAIQFQDNESTDELDERVCIHGLNPCPFDDVHARFRNYRDRLRAIESNHTDPDETDVTKHEIPIDWEKVDIKFNEMCQLMQLK